MTNDLSSILAACLAAIEQRGSSIEECAAQYPDQHEALLQLLPLAATLRAAPIVVPSREFQVAARRRLLARLPVYQASPQRSFGLWTVIWQWLTLRQRALTRIAIAVTAMILFSTSVIAASAQALPNDWLYPVKLAVEQARLTLAFTAQQRSELHLRFVEERLSEVRRLIEIGRGADATSAIDDLANQIEAATQNLSDVSDRAALLAQLNAAIDHSQDFLDQSANQLPASTHDAIQHTRGILRTIPRSEPKQPESQPAISAPPVLPTVTPLPTPTQVPPTRQPSHHETPPPPAWPTIVKTWPMTPTMHLSPWPWPTLRATPPFTWPEHISTPWITHTIPSWLVPTLRVTIPIPWSIWVRPTHIRPTGTFIRPTYMPTPRWPTRTPSPSSNVWPIPISPTPAPLRPTRSAMPWPAPPSSPWMPSTPVWPRP